MRSVKIFFERFQVLRIKCFWALIEWFLREAVVLKVVIRIVRTTIVVIAIIIPSGIRPGCSRLKGWSLVLVKTVFVRPKYYTIILITSNKFNKFYYLHGRLSQNVVHTNRLDFPNGFWCITAMSYQHEVQWNTNADVCQINRNNNYSVWFELLQHSKQR